ncbi:hypothetical protein [Ornithinimicrobium sufpigmenti]|uniref:hypothetical protein n=1 Tax=Ornithinimicrobium sufpigmenti TaxID=2508882 RepID=UPI0010359101|nr:MULTISPECIES: hypothetical protein [unclassified Ornithinimicrobium]
MDAAGWANIIAVIALVGAAVGWFTNARATRYADERAGKALEESRGARQEAARAANALERMARAAEQQEERAAKESQVSRVAWAIHHHRGSTFRLENTGTATAYDVDITVDVARFDPPSEWTLDMPTHMAPGEGVTFGATLAFGDDDTAVITWADAEGAEHRHTWRRPLPPKPTS